MFLGSIAAIGQRNIKRLMAYSSIAHMGYALMGLAAGTAFGVQAMLVYMAIYVTMNVGTFAFILSMERDGKPVIDIGSLNLYSATEPLKALAMMLLMFTLAGVPPLLGFFGKYYVLTAAYDAGLGWLAVAGVIATVIGAFYYLRIVYFMYFGERRAGEGLDASAARRCCGGFWSPPRRRWSSASSTCSAWKGWPRPRRRLLSTEPAPAWPEGVGRIVLTEVDSTMPRRCGACRGRSRLPGSSACARPPDAGGGAGLGSIRRATSQLPWC